MSLHHTTLKTCIEASERIAQHILEFQERGGIIQEIPTGLSGENLQLKHSKRGTNTYEDKNKSVRCVVQSGRLFRRFEK